MQTAVQRAVQRTVHGLGIPWGTVVDRFSDLAVKVWRRVKLKDPQTPPSPPGGFFGGPPRGSPRGCGVCRMVGFVSGSWLGLVQGSRNYMVQNEPELHGFRKVVVVGSRRFSIRSFLEKIL